MRARSRWLGPSVVLPALSVLAAVAGIILVGACAAMGDRAEALFFRQQTAQSALADTIGRVETARPQLAERLYGAEDELHEACAPLREAGQRKIYHQTIGTDLEWEVVGALDTCETKTRQVEQLVQRTESGDDSAALPDLSVAGERDQTR